MSSHIWKDTMITISQHLVGDDTCHTMSAIRTTARWVRWALLVEIANLEVVEKLVKVDQALRSVRMM